MRRASPLPRPDRPMSPQVRRAPRPTVPAAAAGATREPQSTRVGAGPRVGENPRETALVPPARAGVGAASARPHGPRGVAQPPAARAPGPRLFPRRGVVRERGERSDWTRPPRPRRPPPTTETVVQPREAYRVAWRPPRRAREWSPLRPSTAVDRGPRHLASDAASVDPRGSGLRCLRPASRPIAGTGGRTRAPPRGGATPTTG